MVHLKVFEGPRTLPVFWRALALGRIPLNISQMRQPSIQPSTQASMPTWFRPDWPDLRLLTTDRSGGSYLSKEGRHLYGFWSSAAWAYSKPHSFHSPALLTAMDDMHTLLWMTLQSLFRKLKAV